MLPVIDRGDVGTSSLLGLDDFTRRGTQLKVNSNPPPPPVHSAAQIKTAPVPADG